MAFPNAMMVPGFAPRREIVDRILGTAWDNLIGYWQLGELAGTTAVDSSRQKNNGTYTNGFTLGAPSLGTGHACYLGNGTDSFVNIYSANLNAQWNGDEVTFLVRYKNNNTWADGLNGNIVRVMASSSNNHIIVKDSTANKIQILFNAHNEGTAVNLTISRTDPFWIGVNYSVARLLQRCWIDGAQQGADVAITPVTQVWSGALLSTNTLIGAKQAATNISSDWISDVAIWNTSLPDKVIAALTLPVA